MTYQGGCSPFFSSPRGDSQVKLSPPELGLILLAVQPPCISLVEEEASWNDLPRELKPGLDELPSPVN